MSINALPSDPPLVRAGEVPALPGGVAGGLSLPMMAAYIPMMAASAIASAGRLGLFEALAGGPSTPADLAARLRLDPEAVVRLTDFLVAIGHLRRDQRMVANAPHMTQWFSSHGAVDYRAGLDWTMDAWRIMQDLPDAVARGGPDRPLWDRMDAEPALGTRFSRYMQAFASHLLPDLLDRVELPDKAARLLDLGGSHGCHAAGFCQAYPGMSAVIVDLESALGETEGRIAQAGLADRVRTRPGDIRALDWGSGYDVALYLGVAHNMRPDENQRIFAHLARVLRPRGVLVIHDYPRETTPDVFEAAFRLTLLVETGTRTYAFAELHAMLRAAGFADCRLETLQPAEKGALIIARR
ncbi:SAM-dependent methyltransferase [Sphingomonas zeicaulis]|uniref:methyltransferase n=1 Tax=Sphingomonas zeicaulis TaxID=1632740 RepID=UPI003D1B8030